MEQTCSAFAARRSCVRRAANARSLGGERTFAVRRTPGGRLAGTEMRLAMTVFRRRVFEISSLGFFEAAVEEKNGIVFVIIVALVFFMFEADKDNEDNGDNLFVVAAAQMGIGFISPKILSSNAFFL